MAGRKNPAAVALGRRTSPAKASAARQNGRRGGPPPSVHPSVARGLETLCSVYTLTHEQVRLTQEQRVGVIEARAWINRLRVREEA